MNFIKPLLISTTILLSPISFANDNHEDGKKLFDSICAVCHGMSAGGMDMNKRIAPPIAGVRKHYIDAYPDEASFVAAISSWVENQDASKSLMRGAIHKFKIMPPLSVPKEDVAKIAAYIYDGKIEMPKDFEKHMEKMHGEQKGKGKVMMNHNEHMGGDHTAMMMQMGQNDTDHNKNAMMVGLKVFKEMKKKQHRKGKGGMRGMKGMMRQLDLSPQQKQKMQALIQEKRSIMQPLRQELKNIKQTINQLNTTSSDYKKQIFSLADKKAKLVFRMVIEKGEKRMQIESVLSSEQRQKFKQIRQQRFENRQH